MKGNKIIKITLLILSFIFIVSCGEKIGCEKTGHRWLEANYSIPQTCEICGSTEGEPNPVPRPIEVSTELETEINLAWGGEFGYSEGYANYGIYDGYLILLNTYLDDNFPLSFKLADTIFRYKYDFDIYAYKNGKFINIVDAYRKGILTKDDIELIGMYHKEHVKKDAGNPANFDSTYDDQTTVSIDYGSEVLGMPTVTPLSLEEINMINNAYGSTFTYDKYYGVYDDARVFFKETDEQVETSFLLGNSVFRYDTSFEIIVFKNQEILSLQDAYFKGYLSLIDLENISFLHYQNYLAKHRDIDDIDLFEKNYNDIWTLNYFYDRFGNEIPVTEQFLSSQPENKIYYGDFEGYSVYFSPSSLTASETFILGDVVFNYSYYFDIYLTKDEKSVTIEEAYQNDLVSDEAIRNIGFYHLLHNCHSIYEDSNRQSNVEWYYSLNDGAKIYKDNELIINLGNSEDISIYESVIKYSLTEKLDKAWGSTFSYDIYLGTYEDYYVFLVENMDAPNNSYKVGETYFNNDELFELVVYSYNDDKFYDFFELYRNDIFTDEIIEKYGYLFKLLQRYNTYSYLNDEDFENTYSNFLNSTEVTK